MVRAGLYVRFGFCTALGLAVIGLAAITASEAPGMTGAPDARTGAGLL